MLLNNNEQIILISSLLSGRFQDRGSLQLSRSGPLSSYFLSRVSAATKRYLDRSPLSMARLKSQVSVDEYWKVGIVPVALLQEVAISRIQVQDYPQPHFDPDALACRPAFDLSDSAERLSMLPRGTTSAALHQTRVV